MGRTQLVVEVHQPSAAEEGAMERAEDLSLSVTVEDDLVIVRHPEDSTRDYAVEAPVLLRTLADAMADATTREKARHRAEDAMADDAIREKVWDLAEFLMGTITLSDPDWIAIELCAAELAELAGKRRRSDA